jgi:soluble lytic murein transglycosylase-like protein
VIQSSAAHADSGSAYAAFRDLSLKQTLDRMKSSKDFQSRAAIKSVMVSEKSNLECRYASFWTALGMEAEEYLGAEPLDSPSQADLLNDILDYYEKASRCRTELTEKTDLMSSVDRASYRLGLLYLTQARCDLALFAFEHLAEDRESEFASRSLFYRALCFYELGQELSFQSVRQRMIKYFPLSYHTLVLNQIQNALQVGHVSKLVRPAPSEAPVSVDAKTEPQELTLEEVLKKSDTGDVKRQPGEYLKLFKSQAQKFRDNPSLINESSLKEYFPLLFEKEINRYHLGLQPDLVRGLIRQESGFSPVARSSVGALGLMQLMPQTARSLYKVTLKSLLIPAINIKIGSQFLKGIKNKFSNQIDLALAAYNAGPEKAVEWQKRYEALTVKNPKSLRVFKNDKIRRLILVDFFPYRETREYVSFILRNQAWYRILYDSEDVLAPIASK